MSEAVHHQVTPVTIGQLRQAIHDLPDSMIITVVPSVRPGHPGEQEQVATKVGVVENRDTPLGYTLTLEADSPPGAYFPDPADPV